MKALFANWPIALGVVIFATCATGLVYLVWDTQRYRTAVIITTEHAIEHATGITTSISDMETTKGRSPIPMTMILEKAAATSPSPDQQTAFREYVHKSRCTYFDFTPKIKYATYQLNVVDPSGHVVFSETVEPGACFCGRPTRMERRQICL